MYLLPLAYAIQALSPTASTLPTPESLAAFHLASALWYSARWDAVRCSDTKRAIWSGQSVPKSWMRMSVAVHPNWFQVISCAAGSVLQFPLYNPAAAVFPFVLCCLFGMEVSMNSNVMLFFQTMCLCVAVLFDSAQLLPLYTTAVALTTFGTTARKATSHTFLITIMTHALFFVLAAMALVQTYNNRLPLSFLRQSSVCLSAVVCAEARIRAAAECSDSRMQVMWASRAACVGSLLTFVFRILAERETNTPHVSTTALFVLVLCAPWNWTAHVPWRKHTASLTPSGLAITFVFATTAASIASFVLHTPPAK